MIRRVLSHPVILGLMLLVAGCFAGWAGRYLLIEPEHLYRTCLGAAAPWWCALRQDLIRATFTVRGIYGWASAAAAVAAWLLDGPLVAVFVLLALLTGGLGLFLYAASSAALGVLLALLRLVRLPELLMKPPDFRA